MKPNIKLVGLLVCLVLSILYNPTALKAQSTVDLSTHFSGVVPAGSVLEWHNATPFSAANKLTPAQITAATAGTYYVVFYDAASNCYSPARQLSVATNTCPDTSVNLNAHSSAIAPSGTILEWHSAIPVNASNKLTNTQISNVKVGTYFVVFYDTTDNCYSPASPVIVTISPCNPLPVKLLSFTAMPVNAKVLLNWNVASQINVLKYEVEFSADGRNFTNIGSVNATNTNVYSLVHNNPVTGFNYYRIKIIDLDGKLSYSRVRIVKMEKKATLVVYPNPAKSFINISLSDDWTRKSVKITLHNQLGQQVLVKESSSANQILQIPIAGLPDGTYNIRIEQPSSGVTEIRKIVILK